VGPAWTSTFNVTTSQPGYLDFYHFEADPDRNIVSINGVQLGTLTLSDGVIDKDPSVPTNWVNQTLAVPANVLSSGSNTIRVEAGVSFPGSGFPLDDFMLKDMRLVTVPEPTVAFLLLGGLLVAGVWRRPQ
jgi:hypothetical protein